MGLLCLGAPLRPQEPVCALSDKQEQDAPQAFAKLAPIFTHPRCFNCHGGVSPFGNGRGTHPESGFQIARDADGNEDVDRTFAGCHTDGCHDSFPAPGATQTWRLAPFAPDMQFNVSGAAQPKSTLQLCKQMKIRVKVPGAAGFIGHMKDDNGDLTSPFVKVAFAGTLGLGGEGQETAKDQLGSYPLPITGITPGQVLQQSKDWVAAMGGKFRQGDECGCVEKHYALRVLAHGVLQMPGFTFNLRFSGQGTSFPEIPLKFQDDGSFSGEVMAIPETDNQGSFPFISCSGQGYDQIRVEMKGSWADITPTTYEPTNEPPVPPQSPIKVQLKFSQIATRATETCSTPIGAITDSTNKTGPLKYTFDLVFPDPQVNQAAAVDWPAPFPGWSGAVRAQIIEVRQSGQP